MEITEINQSLKKILIVDDNSAFRKITRKILEMSGYKVLEASDGAAAVSLMIEKPDLILQDLILPDITGYDLVHKLRARSDNPFLPILAFSGFLEKQDTPWDTSSGFNALLSKPVQSAELLEAVKTNLPV
jgi:CheY-like chemotaxis protein